MLQLQRPLFLLQLQFLNHTGRQDVLQKVSLHSFVSGLFSDDLVLLLDHEDPLQELLSIRFVSKARAKQEDDTVHCQEHTA